jgi:hypothetical protein
MLPPPVHFAGIKRHPPEYFFRNGELMERMIRHGILILCACLLLLAPASAISGWTPQNISGSVPEPIAADVSGDYVVYSVAWGEAISSSTPRGLLLYAAETGETTVIANSTAKMTLTGGNIDGDSVVWFDEPQLLVDENESRGLYNSIYLYSISEGTTTKIYSSETAEWPKVSGNHILWSESPENTWVDALTVYDISEGAAQDLPDIRVDDPAAVLLDGDHVAYTDAVTKDLTLYDLSSGETTVVKTIVRTNTSFSNIEAAAMGGDYLLYLTRTVEGEGPTREETLTLSLYTISAKTTELISPTEGLVAETEPKTELAATVDSPFTDGTTIGWVLVTGVSTADFVTMTPAGDDPTLLAVDGDIAFPAIDGNRAVWVESKLFRNAHVVLATRDAGTAATPTAAPEPTPAPGFGLTLHTIALMLATIALMLATIALLVASAKKH